MPISTPESTPVNRRAERGFTLVEVVVVIAVISILAATLAPMLAQQIDSARRQATEDHLQVLAQALREYHLDVYAFPADTGNDSADLGQLAANGAAASGWDGPYITDSKYAGGYATDAWGSPIDYAHANGATSVVLTSPGLDRTLATADDIQLTVLMDFDAVRQRVDATYEMLKLIAGDVFGTSPNLAPSGYTIPAQWATDAWGNPNVYAYANDQSAVVYSPGPDGTAASPAPGGDDIFFAMVWDPPGGGGSGSGSGNNGDLTLGTGTVAICGGDEELAFRIDNGGATDLVITQMAITWNDAGAKLKKLKGKSSSVSCGNGNTLWDDDGCGEPGGKLTSTATLTGFCETMTVPAGGSYWFGKLEFDEDINGKNISILFTTQPVGGGASTTSTISFTAP